MADDDAPSSSLLTPLVNRRRFLALGGSLAVGTVVLGACNSGSGSSTSGNSTDPAGTSAPSEASATSDAVTTETSATSDLSAGTPSETVLSAADFAALGTCLVLPELTEGPFPTTQQIERRDVSEGKEGLPLRVGVQVVDESCTPIPGAVVEIWHCDIDGDYSAYADGATTDDAGEGTTFFRGFQVANDEGIVEFLTAYPGWYQGRAVHIHATVHIDDVAVLTTQFLFDDATNTEVFGSGVYEEFGPPDTSDAEDGVTGGRAEADGLLLTVTDDDAIDGRRGLIVVGVDPSTTSSAGAAIRSRP